MENRHKGVQSISPSNTPAAEENILPPLDPHSLASKPFASGIPQAPSLSLPKGRGSIHGMGEKSDVNLSNGTASTSFTVCISAARGSLLPEITLSVSLVQLWVRKRPIRPRLGLFPTDEELSKITIQEVDEKR
jgi:hypothetical protein